MHGFVPATAEHARHVARILRDADRAELEALDMEAEASAIRSIEESDFASTWMVDGVPAVICGLAYEPSTLIGSSRAQVWALTTGDVDRHRRAFWVASRRWVHDAQQQADVLFQFVDARYVSCLRWLVRLGFRIEPARPFGPHQLPFHLAVKER